MGLGASWILAHVTVSRSWAEGAVDVLDFMQNRSGILYSLAGVVASSIDKTLSFKDSRGVQKHVSKKGENSL